MPVFFIATCVSVHISSFIIIGSTDMSYFSVGIIGRKFTARNTMMAAKPTAKTIARMEVFTGNELAMKYFNHAMYIVAELIFGIGKIHR